jgi:hypothetical protein
MAWFCNHVSHSRMMCVRKSLCFISKRPKFLLSLERDSGWSRWSGREDGSICIRFPRPFGRNWTPFDLLFAKGAAPETMLPPIRPSKESGRLQRGIRLPPRLAPQDQYAKGILSLSEKQPKLARLLWRNSNESRR